MSQLIQGTFPNYDQLIPDSHESSGQGTRIIIKLEEFLSATRTASIFARDGSGIIRIQTTRESDGTVGSLTISSRAEEVGDNEGKIDATLEGEDSKIAFNSVYLAEVLDMLGKGDVALEITTPSSPGVLRPLDKEGYVHVVMPMFVQW